MKTNKKALIPVILSVLMLTACSAGSSGASESAFAGASKNSAAYDSAVSYETSSEMYGDYYDSEYSEVNGDNSLADNQKENNTLSQAVRKEMLVYSCNMTVDVLDFQEALDTFRGSFDAYGAFVENENYSDGGSNGHWKYKDAEKWQSYTATVRVPSQSYDDFCKFAADLGDLRGKNASVQNLSAEYYDLSATLEIYEAKEKRYMQLLADITDEEYAIAVEKELTEIEIEISKIKTRMNNIKTDVAYSYVYITINEVKEYTAEPVKTDTFFQRLCNTVSDATSSFLSFMETILFALIYLFPHIVIIGVIVFLIIKAVKASKKRKEAAMAAAAEQKREAASKAAAPVTVQAPEKPEPSTAPEAAGNNENKNKKPENESKDPENSSKK